LSAVAANARRPVQSLSKVKATAPANKADTSAPPQNATHAFSSCLLILPGNPPVRRVSFSHTTIECPMDPKSFSEQMRQARLKSPLLTREQALKQFAEVEAYLAQHNLRPSAKPSGNGRSKQAA